MTGGQRGSEAYQSIPIKQADLMGVEQTTCNGRGHHRRQKTTKVGSNVNSSRAESLLSSQNRFVDYLIKNSQIQD